MFFCKFIQLLPRVSTTNMATLTEILGIFITSIDNTLHENDPDITESQFIMSKDVAYDLRKRFDIFPSLSEHCDNKKFYNIIHDYWVKNRIDIEECDRMWLMICRYLAELDFQLFSIYNCNKEKYNYSSFLETAREKYCSVMLAYCKDE